MIGDFATDKSLAFKWEEKEDKVMENTQTINKLDKVTSLSNLFIPWVFLVNSYFLYNSKLVYREANPGSSYQCGQHCYPSRWTTKVVIINEIITSQMIYGSWFYRYLLKVNYQVLICNNLSDFIRCYLRYVYASMTIRY